ncbi:MAG TPA: hypothetical protein GX507_10130 [Clostridia bacterium]|nr:hypothetical protein [Clostridia bacterium]
MKNCIERAGGTKTRQKKRAGRRLLTGIAVVMLFVFTGFGVTLVRSFGSPTAQIIKVAAAPAVLKDVETAIKQVSETAGVPRPIFQVSALPCADVKALVKEGKVDLGILLADRDTESDSELERTPVGKKAFFFLTPLFSPKADLSLHEARRLLEVKEYFEDRPPTAAPSPTVTASPSDATRGALSVYGFGLYGDEIMVKGSLEDIPPGFRPLAVDGVMPTPRNLRESKYPAVFPVELVVKKAPQSAVLRFVGEVRRILLPSSCGAADVEESLVHTLRSSMKPDYGSILLSAVGDVMLSRRVGKLMETEGDDYPFTDVAPFFADSSLVVANLESPIGTTGRPIPNKMIWFRAKPSAASALKRAGIDVVCLANNHILDYDTENLLETMDLLDRAGIKYFGAGRNLEEARRPLIVERNGIRIGFLGYSEFARPGLYWSKAYPRSFDATPTSPGCAPLNEVFLEEDIRKTRDLCDFLVVMIHWGAEDTNIPKPFIVDQRKVAALALKCGADVVLGTHPHALQGFEVMGKGLCAYSLGNFIMDQRREIQKESVILNMYVSQSGLSGISVHPVYIEECKPRILEGERASKLFTKLREISEALLDAETTAENP